MMRRLSDLPLRDLELLSAYLDGELTPREADRLQARLDGEADLRWALEELRRTVSVVRSLPEVRPPRSFTLSAEAAGSRGRAAAYPVLQLATALATLAFVAVVGLDALTSRATGVALAPEFRDQGQLLTAAPVEEAVQAPTSEPAQALSASAPEEPPAASDIQVVGSPTPEAPVGLEIERSAPGAEPGTATAFPTPMPEESAAAERAVMVEGTPCEVCGGGQGPAEAEPLIGAAPLGSPSAQTTPTPAPQAEKLGGEPEIADQANAPASFSTPSTRARASLPTLRLAEIGLGLAAALLASLTFRVRRKR